jgi:hypothetical protein
MHDKKKEDHKDNKIAVLPILLKKNSLGFATLVFSYEMGKSGTAQVFFLSLEEN